MIPRVRGSFLMDSTARKKSLGIFAIVATLTAALASAFATITANVNVAIAQLSTYYLLNIYSTATIIYSMIRIQL